MKLDCCDLCRFYSRSPYLVCAEYPAGVEGDSCPDFRLVLRERPIPEGEPWQPLGASYYGDDLVLDPVQRLSLEQQLEMLDVHPLFTGRCPNCERPIPQAVPGQIHWDCGHCGWGDDSV